MIRTAVLTVSDSGKAGTREDRSGPAVTARCEAYGWQIAARELVADNREEIGRQLKQWADSDAVQLILTTGGTGVALRDVTPEATSDVLERTIPGLAEVMRSEGRTKTKFAVLSRGLAGTRGRSLIVNLPGSTAGAVESLESIAALIPHVIELLEGKTEH